MIQFNMQTLRKQLESIDNLHVVETIFSNFNLFPIMNNTNEINHPLIGLPISHLITNLRMMKNSGALVRIRISASDVKKFAIESISILSDCHSIFR